MRSRDLISSSQKESSTGGIADTSCLLLSLLQHSPPTSRTLIPGPETMTGDSGEMMNAEQFKVEGPPDGLPLNAAKSPYRTRSGRISKPNPKYQD